jgi:hypothetical protein
MPQMANNWDWCQVWHQLRFWLALVIVGFVHTDIWSHLIFDIFKTTTHKPRIDLIVKNSVAADIS